MKSQRPSDNVAYADQYRNVDFRAHPEKYVIGKGEQGVLIAEPYKSEILAIGWRFKTEAEAEKSSAAILAAFYDYLDQDDFVGADMARKFLMMGWTRARRYANHPSGRKYDEEDQVAPQAQDAMTSEKARSAQIFKRRYDEARQDAKYLRLMVQHREHQTKRGSDD